MSAPKKYDFTGRKSVHIHIMKSQHAEFRAKVMLAGLTMQDVLEECAIRIAEGESYMERLINDVVNKKTQGELQVAKAEIESIYEAIKSGRNPKDE
tara:strand:+ start:2081 stop:2368 length:288 start_codon:yes stop_codon:yes gene_type:complete